MSRETQWSEPVEKVRWFTTFGGRIATEPTDLHVVRAIIPADVEGEITASVYGEATELVNQVNRDQYLIINGHEPYASLNRLFDARDFANVALRKLATGYREAGIPFQMQYLLPPVTEITPPINR